MQKTSKKTLTIADPFTDEQVDTPIGYVARLAGVDRSTARRWALAGEIPTAHERYLAAVIHGVPPDPDWHRFRFRSGYLVNTVTGERFTPQQMETVYLAHQQVSCFRQELERLQRPLEHQLTLIKS